jgi:hypothetical protein
MANWKPAVKVIGEGDKWCLNNLVFATQAEALASSVDLMSRWMMVVEAGAVETEDPVNYKYTGPGHAGLIAVESTTPTPEGATS